MILVKASRTVIFTWVFFANLAMVQAERPTLWGGFGDHLAGSFTGTNLLLHGAGFISTGVLINTGIDARLHENFQHQRNDAAFPGAVIGTGAAALVGGGWLYLKGKEGDDESLGGAYAIVQASLITVAYIGLLKVTTGRAHATKTWHLSPQAQSEQFQFGLFRNGATAYGWPSGHVSHTVAVSAALAHYYPEKTWVKWAGMGLSAYMIYAVSAWDYGQMHWFSDAVAGAFFGYAIGSTVGSNFRKARGSAPSEESSSQAQLSVLPILGPQTTGLSIRYLVPF